MKMKNFLYGLTLLVSFPFLNMRSLACSPVITPEENVKEAMIIVLEERLHLTPGLIKSEDLTTPESRFPQGLGADCSGLDQAYMTSRYDFTVQQASQRCHYKGEIRMNGLYLRMGSTFNLNPEMAVCQANAPT